MSLVFLQDDYRRAADARIRELEAFLGSGKATDYTHYREVVGQISGIKQSLDLLKRVAERHGEIEDLDDE